MPSASLQEATKQLGWDVTIFDGKSNPAEYSKGVYEAVAAGADAIIDGLATLTPDWIVRRFATVGV